MDQSLCLWPIFLLGYGAVVKEYIEQEAMDHIEMQCMKVNATLENWMFGHATKLHKFRLTNQKYIFIISQNTAKMQIEKSLSMFIA